MRVLILGKDGMLGSTLEKYLKISGVSVTGTSRRNDDDSLYLNVDRNETTVPLLVGLFNGFDFIVNCLVARNLKSDPSLKEAIFVNSVFPHLAAEACSISDKNFIHISTDGVFSGFGGPYFEDDLLDGVGLYSNSKILGETHEFKSLNIRCSIIGHEVPIRGGLLEWFLSQNGPVVGYRDTIWNGVTTLQLSEFIYELISSSSYQNLVESTRVIHYSPNEPLSKFELLAKIARVYEKNIEIKERDSGVKVSRILKSRFDSYYKLSAEFDKVLKDLFEFHLAMKV